MEEEYLKMDDEEAEIFVAWLIYAYFPFIFRFLFWFHITSLGVLVTYILLK